MKPGIQYCLDELIARVAPKPVEERRDTYKTSVAFGKIYAYLFAHGFGPPDAPIDEEAIVYFADHVSDKWLRRNVRGMGKGYVAALRKECEEWKKQQDK